MSAIEVNIPGPHLDPYFWRFEAGRWTYDGPYSPKRDRVIASASLHVVDGETERVVPAQLSSMAPRLTSDSFIFTLPEGTDIATLKAVWFVFELPRDPRRRGVQS